MKENYTEKSISDHLSYFLFQRVGMKITISISLKIKRPVLLFYFCSRINSSQFGVDHYLKQQFAVLYLRGSF